MSTDQFAKSRLNFSQKGESSGQIHIRLYIKVLCLSVRERRRGKINTIYQRIKGALMNGLNISSKDLETHCERMTFLSFFLSQHSFFSSRLYGANEHCPQPPASLGRHGGPPVCHQHLQAPPVPHGHIGLAIERPGLALPGHHIVSGLAVYVAAVHAQHELWTTRQSAGERAARVCGRPGGHRLPTGL